MMRWWLDRGIDGFRLDVIDVIDKPPVFADVDVDAEASGTSAGTTALADAMGLVVNGPRLTRYLRELRREVLGDRRDVLLLGETPDVGAAQAAALTDPVDGPLDLVFAFEHSELDREPARWRSRPWTYAGSRTGPSGGRPGTARRSGTPCSCPTMTSQGSCPAMATTAGSLTRGRPLRVQGRGGRPPGHSVRLSGRRASPAPSARRIRPRLRTG